VLTSHATSAEQRGAAAFAERGRSLGAALRSTGKFLRTKPLGAFGALIVLALVLTALIGPTVAPYPVNESVKQDGRSLQYAKPSREHLFGTDIYGRDVFSRVLVGARTTVTISLIAMSIGAAGGLFLGMVSGYFAGKTDLLLQRVMDAVMAFPGLVLAMTVVAFIGTEMRNVFLVVGILVIPGFQRLIRGAVLAEKETAYVLAARAIGAGNLRIMFRHILLNVLPLLIVVVSIGMGGIVLIEAGLSYLGLGTPAPTPSWGRDFGEARTVVVSYPWLAIFPGAAIALVVLGFNLFGDALRDVLDPRLRGGR